MDQSSLVAPFRRIILAALPLLLGAGFNLGCGPLDCPESAMTFTVNQTDAGSGDGGIDDLIARCQASASDCSPLCGRLVVAPFTSCQRVTVDGGDLVLRIVAPNGGNCE